MERALKRWVSHPERYPHRCPWSHQDAPADGPYLDTGLVYFAAREIDNHIEPDRRESALVISVQALREASQLPGSPIVVTPRDMWDDVESENVRLREANEGLKLDCERLEEALDEAYANLNAMTDPEAIAAALVGKLDERYARKPGPKPKDAA